jgi:hypothetical protein
MAMCGLLTSGTPLFAGTCVGDFTGDGTVDGADLGVLLSGWGGPGGDLDGDGLTGAADLAILLGAWGPCSSSGCTSHFSMIFAGETVPVVAGNSTYRISLSGCVIVSPSGSTSGAVNATLPNGEVCLIDFSQQTCPVCSVPGATLDFAPGLPAGLVLLNGVPTQVPAVLDPFYLSASSGSSLDSWAPASRATLAFAALASTSQWQCNVEAALVGGSPLDGGVAGQGFWCKCTAYGAATIIAGLAAGGCAALTGGCAVGTAVTIGGMSVPCVVLIGLCGAAGFAGTAAAYEAVLALWGD